MSCDNDDEAVEQRTEDGRKVVRICRKIVAGSALKGLRSAREAIAGDARMNAEIRRKILEDLDREIERLEKKPNG